MKERSTRLALLAGCAALSVFFAFLFYTDNKYQTPPPYGKDGVLDLCEEDLAQGRPLFLIDGWLLRDARVQDQPTYIGEFSSLQRGDASVSPHGKARYTLTLRYAGAPQSMALSFPELFSQYVLSLDGVPLAHGVGNAQLSFRLEPGEHLLSVETQSVHGYYSGMYYPPALGTPAVLAKLESVRNFAYALAFLVPLSLALFTLLLWRTGGTPARCFGLLCCCYALYVSYYWVQLFQFPFASQWFFIENLSLYGLCFCVVRLTALTAGGDQGVAFRRIRGGLLLLPACLLALCLLIPVFPPALPLHGTLSDLYFILTSCAAVFLALRAAAKRSLEQSLTLVGCAVLALGLLCNWFFANHFEPIHFFWQFEWCGLFLVLLFGATMVARNRRILRENEQLTAHLEEVVAHRTEELGHLLQERKAFFSDMAHDLKAPVFATQAFIAAIREGRVGVDSELAYYLDQAEQKQRELARRLQGLSSINDLDRIEEPKVALSVCTLLEEVYATHHAAAEVLSIHLRTVPPPEDAILLAQPEKIQLLFENLIYNALRATPPDGSVMVSAHISEQGVRIMVADTGCGIAAEELSLVFRRFYVGRRNREYGSGLGLYIVQSIVEDLGGSISLSSTLGEGSVFCLDFPHSD